MAKTSKEEMLLFIEENKNVYGGKTDLSTIAEADTALIEKTYRAIKTKLWQMSRTSEAKSSLLARVKKCTTSEQLDKLKAELEEALEAVDKARAQLKEAAKTQLQAQIEELQRQLESLNEDKK